MEFEEKRGGLGIVVVAVNRRERQALVEVDRRRHGRKRIQAKLGVTLLAGSAGHGAEELFAQAETAEAGTQIVVKAGSPPRRGPRSV